METAYELRFGYYIKVYDGRYPTDRVLKILKWENFTFQLFCKYRWYFEYRYALLRVQYPKNLIEHNQLRRELNEKEIVDSMKNKIIGKKRTITKYKNKLLLFKQNWVSLFSFEDYEPYIAAVAKIARLEKELIELEKEYNEK